MRKEMGGTEAAPADRRKSLRSAKWRLFLRKKIRGERRDGNRPKEFLGLDMEIMAEMGRKPKFDIL